MLWELDKLSMPVDQVQKHVVPPGRIAAHERCVLYRRRAGYSQTKVAREIGYCRWYVNQMETGLIDCTPLCSYWES